MSPISRSFVSCTHLVGPYRPAELPAAGSFLFQHTLCRSKFRSESMARSKKHCCIICCKGFNTEPNLNRHISNSRDDNHQALRALVRRGTLRPERGAVPPPDIEPQDDPNDYPHDPMDLDHAEWFGVDDDALADNNDSEARFMAHADTLDAANSEEPVRDVYESAGQPRGRVQPPHAAFQKARDTSGLPFYPFKTELDYDVAQWVITESISNSAFDRFLKKHSVRPQFCIRRALIVLLGPREAGAVIFHCPRTEEATGQDPVPRAVDASYDTRQRLKAEVPASIP